MEKNYSRKESKYQPIFNKEIADILQTLTGQKPYIFPNLKKGKGFIYSFVRNEEFDKVLKMVLTQYTKNNKNK